MSHINSKVNPWARTPRPYVQDARSGTSPKSKRAREAALRRKMQQNGHRILTSRQRNRAPTLNNFGGYMVIDVTTSHTPLGRRFDPGRGFVENFDADGGIWSEHFRLQSRSGRN